MHKDADGFYTAASCESPASIPPCDPSPMSNPATEPPAEDAASPSHPDAGKQQTPHIIQHLTVRNDTQLQTSSSPLSRSRYVYARLGEQRRVVELLDRDGFQVTLADQQADPNSPLFSAKTFEELGLSVDRSGKWWREACSCASWCTDIKISSRASTIWASQNLPRSRSVLFLSCLQTRECNTAILGCLVVAERDSPITSNTRFCSARKWRVTQHNNLRPVSLEVTVEVACMAGRDILQLSTQSSEKMGELGLGARYLFLLRFGILIVDPHRPTSRTQFAGVFPRDGRSMATISWP